MRILVIINSLHAGGAEKLVADSIPLLHKEVDEIQLLLLSDSQSPFLDSLQEKANIKIHSLTKGSVYNPILIFKIRRFIKNFDLVHVHLFPALYWSSLASLFMKKKPVLVFTEHNTSNKRRNALFRILDRFIYKAYKRIIVISEEVKEQLKTHIKAGNDKFSLIRNGIDLKVPAKAKPAELPFIGNSDVLITMVASFYPQKDQDTLIRALPDLDTNCKLVFVGDGPRKGECEQLSKDLNVDDRVFFLGIRRDVPSIMKASKLVVLSSYFEGVSLSAIEGMASGNPFIASDVPGLTNMVKGYGVLFEQGNHQQLASLIQKLITDDEYYCKVTEGCLVRASHYDLNDNVKAHLELYHSLLSDNGQ